jgi:hypothetical protein
MIQTTLFVAICLGATLAAQTPGAGRVYDKTTEFTFKGTIEEVREVGAMPGVHLFVKVAEQSYRVHLGPKSYLEREHWTFSKGDLVEITGSKVKVGGRGTQVVLARELRRDSNTLVLRDAAGAPKWARLGKRQ